MKTVMESRTNPFQDQVTRKNHKVSLTTVFRSVDKSCQEFAVCRWWKRSRLVMLKKVGMLFYLILSTQLLYFYLYMFLLNKLQMTMFWIFTWCKIYLYVSVLIISKRTKFLKPLFHSRGNCWTTERGRQWWRRWWWLNIASYIGTHKDEFGYLPTQEEAQSDDMEPWDI